MKSELASDSREPWTLVSGFAFCASAISVITCAVNNLDPLFNPARVALVLVFLILLSTLLRPSMILNREARLYAAFLIYMGISTFWTPIPSLALNTLGPAFNCLLLIILFTSLVTYHSTSATISGSLLGFSVSAAGYTVLSGFPLRYPKDFSYNSVAAMYLFGLFIVLMFGAIRGRRFFATTVSLVLMGMIAATTSIKTNLGIVLGALVSSALHFRQSIRSLRKSFFVLCMALAALCFAVLSNDQLQEQLNGGFDRIYRGVQILQQRDDSGGGTSFGDRQYWIREGIKGWVRNPIFGYGVEAFRADYGITSHSTPVDLLYNDGVIGLLLFYSIFGSIALRLHHLRFVVRRDVQPIMLATLVCYLFMMISGTLHYHSFLAIYVGISTGILRGDGQIRRSRAVSISVSAPAGRS
jgi:hypothetical protein